MAPGVSSVGVLLGDGVLGGVGLAGVKGFRNGGV